VSASFRVPGYPSRLSTREYRVARMDFTFDASSMYTTECPMPGDTLIPDCTTTRTDENSSVCFRDIRVPHSEAMSEKKYAAQPDRRMVVGAGRTV
jgi:hypothetical protein